MKKMRKNHRVGLLTRLLSLTLLTALVVTYVPFQSVMADQRSEEKTLQQLYDEWKDVKADKYTTSTYATLTKALAQAKMALTGKAGLLKDTENWYVVKPGVGTPISQTEFAEGDYGYDFPIKFTDNGTYLNMTLISQGLYEGTSSNWQARQNYYMLPETMEVDFAKDKLDFEISSYMNEGKNAWIQAAIILHFEELGSVSLETGSTDRYMTKAGDGYGRGYIGNIAMSELKNYMSDEQKTALVANGNKATLTRVDVYHNQDSMGGNYNASQVWGIDIYKFDVILSEDSVEKLSETAYTALQEAIKGLKEKRTMAELRTLYEQWKDVKKEDYPEKIYETLQEALTETKTVIEKGTVTELLKDTKNWYVVKPGVGTPVSQTEFATGNYGYDFPVKFSDNGTYLNMVLTSHGLYEGSAANWQGRQNYYILSNATEVDFLNDRLDFELTFYMNEAKNGWIQGYVILHFEELGSVTLESCNDRYMTKVSDGYGRGVEGNIPLSDLKQYMSTEQLAALEENGNKATLTRVDVYHNSDTLWNNYNGASQVWGIDIYKFNIIRSEDVIQEAYEELETAADNATAYENLKKLYEKWDLEDTDDYTPDSLKIFEKAMAAAKDLLDGTASAQEELLKDTANWKVQDPAALATYISAGEYTQKGYSYDFPIKLTDNNGVLNVVLTSHGLYEGGDINWKYRKNLYDLSSKTVDVDFENDRLDFELAFYINEAKNEWIQGYVTLYFEELGAVNLEACDDRYLTKSGAGYGRGVVGNIAMSDLKKYMSDEQKSLLEANNNKATLTRVEVYHNPDALWNAYAGPDQVYGFDIYKFNVVHSEAIYVAAYEELQDAVAGLKINKIYNDLRALYAQWKDEEQGYYTITTYTELKEALTIAGDVLDGKTELLKDAENWWAVKPWHGTPISQSEFAQAGYEYAFPLKLTDNGTYLNMVLTSHGLYENDSKNWQGRQNYYYLTQPILVDFENTRLDFELTFYMNEAKNEWIQGCVILHFDELGTVALENCDDRYLTKFGVGYGRGVVGNIPMSDLKQYMSKEQIAILEENGNKATLSRVDVYHNQGALANNYELGADQIWGIDIYKFNIVYSEASYTYAYEVLKDAVDKLEKTDKKFVFDNLGEWYVKNPDSQGETYIAQSANKDILEIVDKRAQEEGYYRVALLKKGLYELPEAVGTYNTQYVFAEALDVDFYNHSIYLDMHATCVSQENMDVKYYIDLWFEGYDKPVRMSMLYEDNRGLSQGRTMVTARLCEFMDESWEDEGFRDFVKRNNGLLKLTRIDVSATFDGNNWQYGGESFLIRDFSIGNTRRATAADITARVTELSASNYVTTLADRDTIRELAKDYKYMDASEQAKLSASVISAIEQLVDFAEKAEKSAYLFEDIFADKENWQSTGAFDELDLANSLGSVMDEKAYLDFRSGNGSMLIYPTGVSLTKKAFHGGAATGWSNLFYDCEEPIPVSLSDSCIYYDIESNVKFLIMLHFNESSEGIAICQDMEIDMYQKESNRYTGVIDVAKLVKGMSEEELRKYGIYGTETVYITKIRFQEIADQISNVSLGHFLNIRTLAVSESKNAYYNTAQYKKEGYSLTQNGGLVSDVTIRKGDSQNYDEVKDDTVMAEFQKVSADGSLSVHWWIFGIAAAVILAGGVVLILVLARKKRHESEGKGGTNS